MNQHSVQEHPTPPNLQIHSSSKVLLPFTQNHKLQCWDDIQWYYIHTKSWYSISFI